MKKPVKGTKCQQFLFCKNNAVKFVPHIILGNVPTCKRCADKLNTIAGMVQR